MIVKLALAAQQSVAEGLLMYRMCIRGNTSCKTAGVLFRVHFDRRDGTAALARDAA